MKQDQHIDVDAMLRELPATADKALNDLQATPFLKARIDRAVAEKNQGKVRFALPKWAPAVCCAAVVLVLALVFVPMDQQPGNLINSPWISSRATSSTPVCWVIPPCRPPACFPLIWATAT